jgi:hypothetical protein
MIADEQGHLVVPRELDMAVEYLPEMLAIGVVAVLFGCSIKLLFQYLVALIYDLLDPR